MPDRKRAQGGPRSIHAHDLAPSQVVSVESEGGHVLHFTRTGDVLRVVDSTLPRKVASQGRGGTSSSFSRGTPLTIRTRSGNVNLGPIRCISVLKTRKEKVR
jgi:hypothetical protein